MMRVILERGSRMKPSEFVAKGWCQKVFAKSRDGWSTHADSPDAIKWCLVGALTAAYPEANEERSLLTYKLIDKLNGLGFAAWNDDPKRTQAEVVALLQSIGE